MGAIIGALYAIGWDAARIEAYARTFDPRTYVDSVAFRLPDVAFSRVVQVGTALRSLFRGHAVDSGSKAHAELRRLYGAMRIEELPIPFACTACDLASGKLIVQSAGNLADAVRASMSFPGAFAPVALDGFLLIDGGVLDSLPCDVAVARGYRKILASDVSPFREVDPASLTNGLGVLMRCFDMASEKAQGNMAALADLVITSTDERAAFDFNNAGTVIDLGERCARAAGDDIDRFFAKGPSRMTSLVAKLFPWKRSRVQ
jgi:NTE family protein